MTTPASVVPMTPAADEGWLFDYCYHGVKIVSLHESDFKGARVHEAPFSLLFLTMVLSSSGMGGGTGAPVIVFTAPKRGGHASKQVPHFMHFSWSMTWIRFLPPAIASTGHFLKQIMQAWHLSGSIWYEITSRNNLSTSSRVKRASCASLFSRRDPSFSLFTILM